VNWYILQALSGQEKRIASLIKDQSLKEGVAELISDVIVPIENVPTIRRGKKMTIEKRFLPGYILVRMELNDQVLHFLKGIPKIGRFLGEGGMPQKVSNKEVENIMAQIQHNAVEREKAMLFQAGDSVKINDGPFESFVGNVEEVDVDKKRLKVCVMIFGRSTPLDLGFNQVTKVND
jgi:transcription termination/antitermination protein NusG